MPRASFSLSLSLCALFFPHPLADDRCCVVVLFLGEGGEGGGRGRERLARAPLTHQGAGGRAATAAGDKFGGKRLW